MSEFSQEKRFIHISEFSFEEDTLLPVEIVGSESVSDLFQFNVTVLSEKPDLSPDDIVGQTCTVTVNSEKKRKFNGYIVGFEYGEMVGRNLREYQMTMVPWLWFLGQTNNHRIFQNESTKDIVSKIFKDWGFSDFDFQAKGGETREYCVQHNESDLHFVSRLLEQEGIAYYFKHEDSKHKMVLVDQKNAYETVADTNLQYTKGSTSDNVINKWDHLHSFKKGQWALNDFDFKQPTKSLLASVTTKSKFANNGQYEHYQYPGSYNPENASLVKELASIRLDAEEAQRCVVDGAGNCTSFTAGGRFAMDKAVTNSEKGEYILLSVHHQAFDRTYDIFSNGAAGYSNIFKCIPADVQFRPMERHHQQRMAGPQSAIVVGPSGEEIHVDDMGRIKVQFIWDREGKMDQDSSCYVRVMQTWAGNQWGASFIPRIGHEVIVNFLDGDPDRPIITGTVYNGKNSPPFESKTQSGIRTRSTKGGSGSNCNELRFDDKKDAEQIYVHAEKNLDTEVENDETHTVDNDRTKHIKHDETATIDNDRTKHIGNDETSTIDNDRKKTIGGNQDEEIKKNKTTSVGENHTESITGNMTITVDGNVVEKIKGDYREDVDKNKNSTIGEDLKEQVDGGHTETVKKDYILKAKKIQVTAEKEISFKVGSASILMKDNGDITIKGKKINVKGSSDVIIKGSKIKAN